MALQPQSPTTCVSHQCNPPLWTGCWWVRRWPHPLHPVPGLNCLSSKPSPASYLGGWIYLTNFSGLSEHNAVWRGVRASLKVAAINSELFHSIIPKWFLIRPRKISQMVDLAQYTLYYSIIKTHTLYSKIYSRDPYTKFLIILCTAVLLANWWEGFP